MGPRFYRLVLPNENAASVPPDPPEEHVDSNDGLRESGDLNSRNAETNHVNSDPMSARGGTDGGSMSAMGGTTYARESPPEVDEVRGGMKVGGGSSPSVGGVDDEVSQGATHSAEPGLGYHHIAKYVEWTACRLECRNGCIDPSGVCVKPQVRHHAKPAAAPMAIRPLPPPPPLPPDPVASTAWLLHFADDDSAWIGQGGAFSVDDVVKFAKPSQSITRADAVRMGDQFRAAAPYAADRAVLDDLFTRLIEPCIQAGFVHPGARRRLAEFKQRHFRAEPGS
jgi:hypothetical protein